MYREFFVYVAESQNTPARHDAHCRWLRAVPLQRVATMRLFISCLLFSGIVAWSPAAPAAAALARALRGGDWAVASERHGGAEWPALPTGATGEVAVDTATLSRHLNTIEPGETQEEVFHHWVEGPIALSVAGLASLVAVVRMTDEAPKNTAIAERRPCLHLSPRFCFILPLPNLFIIHYVLMHAPFQPPTCQFSRVRLQVLSLFEMFMHLKHYNMPLLQRQIVRIIAIVPIYAVGSFLSLLLPSAAIYFGTVRDIYEAYVIHSFLTLMLDYPGGEPAVVAGILDKPRMKHPVPCCCCPRARLDHTFIQWCKRGTLQFVFIKPALAITSLILMMFGEFSTPAWQGVLLVVYNLSYTTALYVLLLYYLATKHLLVGFSAVGKFSAVKLIVFATYYQSLLVAVIPGMDSLGSTESWNDFIICLEMAGFAVMHMFFFSHKEFLPGGVGMKNAAAGEADAVNIKTSTTVLAALGRASDVLSVKDIVQDAYRNFSLRYSRYIMHGVEGGIVSEGRAEFQMKDDEEAAHDGKEWEITGPVPAGSSAPAAPPGIAAAGVRASTSLGSSAAAGTPATGSLAAAAASSTATAGGLFASPSASSGATSQADYGAVGYAPASPTAAALPDADFEHFGETGTSSSAPAEASAASALAASAAPASALAPAAAPLPAPRAPKRVTSTPAPASASAAAASEYEAPSTPVFAAAHTDDSPSAGDDERAEAAEAAASIVGVDAVGAPESLTEKLMPSPVPVTGEAVVSDAGSSVSTGSNASVAAAGADAGGPTLASFDAVGVSVSAAAASERQRRAAERAHALKVSASTVKPAATDQPPASATAPALGHTPTPAWAADFADALAPVAGAATAPVHATGGSAWVSDFAASSPPVAPILSNSSAATLAAPVATSAWEFAESIQLPPPPPPSTTTAAAAAWEFEALQSGEATWDAVAAPTAPVSTMPADAASSSDAWDAPVSFAPMHPSLHAPPALAAAAKIAPSARAARALRSAEVATP